MTATAQQKLRLSSETIRSLQQAAIGKELPQATTLSACRGGCKANTGICSL